MGSPNFETGHRDDEGPVHKVTITQPFALAKTHITRGQFAAFVNESNYQVVAILGCLDVSRGKLDTREGVTWRDPSYQQNDSHPVVCMHRIDAKAYTDWLSRKTGKRYRLPSEAEWEYAARAGTNTARYWGDSADQACGNANVIDNTGESRVFEGKKLEVHDCSDGYVYTSPVASFKPNAFGLYDMIGNAWQLVEDCNYRSYNGAPTDGSAWTNGTCEWRVQRGGSFASNPQVARSAVRASSGFRFNDVGFRVARSD
jgi:formylglycine-generating enzyme required for sulfatase activity